MKSIFKLSETKRKPEDFDKEQLDKGISVEKEHTSDKKEAEQIAMDHLEESKDFKDGKGAKYYDKHEKMEEEIKDELKEAEHYFDLMKFAKKGKKKKEEKENNAWAICTTSVGGKEGTTERSKWDKGTEDKYERCVRKVKKKSKD